MLWVHAVPQGPGAEDGYPRGGARPMQMELRPSSPLGMLLGVCAPQVASLTLLLCFVFCFFSGAPHLEVDFSSAASHFAADA